MAQPTTVPYKKFKVLLGNGATPEVFTAPCAMRSRSFTMTADTNDSTVPDCDDEELPVWVQRMVSTLSAAISADGVMALGDVATWRTWFLSGAAKNCRILFDQPGAQGGGYFEGAFMLTSFESSADRALPAEVSVALTSAGAITWTANA